MKFSLKSRRQATSSPSDPSISNQKEEDGLGQTSDVEKTTEQDNSDVPFLTLRTLVMTGLAAMGGFIFVRLPYASKCGNRH